MHDTKITLKGTIVWLVCAVFFTYEFLLRTVLGTFQSQIMVDFDISPFRFALLSTSAFILIYGLMQMPVGFIADRFGLKKSLLFAVLVCSLSCVLFAFSSDFKIAFIVRMLMGLGASFGFICLLVSVYDWMPKQHYGLFIGLSQFIGTLGPMTAAGPFNAIAQNEWLNWQSLLICLGLFGLVLVIPVLLVVKNKQENVGKFIVIKKTRPFKQSLTTIFFQKQIWVIALYSGLTFFSLEYLSENEGKAFLEIAGFSSHFASYMITVGWLGYAFGCPMLGLLSDHMKRRKVVMILAACLAVLSLLCIIYWPSSELVVTIAFFLLGVGAAGQSVGFAMMAEQCNKYYLAAGLGFNNTMIALISSINAPLIGYVVDMHSEQSMISLSDYHFAFGFIVALTTIGLFVSIFYLKETYCRSNKQLTILTSHQ